MHSSPQLNPHLSVRWIESWSLLDSVTRHAHLDICWSQARLLTIRQECVRNASGMRQSERSKRAGEIWAPMIKKKTTMERWWKMMHFNAGRWWSMANSWPDLRSHRILFCCRTCENIRSDESIQRCWRWTKVRTPSWWGNWPNMAQLPDSVTSWWLRSLPNHKEKRRSISRSNSGNIFALNAICFCKVWEDIFYGLHKGANNFRNTDPDIK